MNHTPRAVKGFFMGEFLVTAGRRSDPPE
jgi:hypothetical protein